MINHCVNIIFGLHIACILSTNWVLGEKSGYDTLQYYSAPLVISTWPFVEAASQAYHVLDVGGSALSAIVAGCSECQKLQCDGTVGFGGSPDESGETSLDAMLMDGDSMDVGAVANLRNVRDAIKVARFVLENTEHSLLAGFEASEFAVRMGLRYYDSLSTPKSRGQYEEWKSKKCQPNFWRNVRPDSRKACGPYHPFGNVSRYPTSLLEDQPKSHDTISMIALDRLGSLASGSSTNGLRHKIPGRVGDAAVPGAGSYADGDVGACAATGDGDVTMRFLPCYQVGFICVLEFVFSKDY